MSVRRGVQFVPIGIPTICWKTFPANTTKMLSVRNANILMMASSEYFFLESECSFAKYISSWPKTRYFYLQLPFLKMKEFRMILASLLFSLSWTIKTNITCFDCKDCRWNVRPIDIRLITQVECLLLLQKIVGQKSLLNGTLLVAS